MCGIWAFNGTPSYKTLVQIICKADERGGHGYGFFGITKKNEHIYIVAHGRPDPEALAHIATDCVMAIGHSRLITGGDYQIVNSQPVLSDGLAIVHNGNIENHLAIMSRYEYTPRTTLDSEALIPLINNFNAALPEAAWIAIRYSKYKAQLMAYNEGLPLYTKRIKNTIYYCSKQWETP
jgi:glucosamine 6-phosphate synthetase-like amidotransferase/phosphosugar isomerase protein